MDDPAVRVVVLTGEGPAFCAGADLKAGGAAVAPGAGQRNPFVEILRGCGTARSRSSSPPTDMPSAAASGWWRPRDIAIAVDTADVQLQRGAGGGDPGDDLGRRAAEAGRPPDHAALPHGTPVRRARSAGLRPVHRVVPRRRARRRRGGGDRRHRAGRSDRRRRGEAPRAHGRAAADGRGVHLRRGEDRRAVRVRRGRRGHGRVRGEAEAALGARAVDPPAGAA